MPKQVLDLTVVYAKARDEVNDIVFGGDVAETRSAYAKRVNAGLKDVEERLNKANKAYVATLPKPDRASNNAVKATVTGFVAKLNDVRRGTYIELNTGVKAATGAIKTEINKAFRKLNKSDNHMGTYLDVIKSVFENRDIMTVEYQNGARIKLGNYAAMLARTSRIETENVNGFINALEDGTDLVQCIGQSPTCELCAIYRDRVFSITGKSKDYPPLYDGADSPLRNGYNAIHPNCRCQFIPYYPELETKEQVEKDRARSNEPFTDNRTKKERDEYAAWQSTNRKLWSEQAEYERIRDVLGDKMPYDTLAGFRRVKRVHDDYMHCTTFDNPTKKEYNNYNRLKREYKTISTIRKKGHDKGYSSDYIKKMEDTYYDFRQSGIELTDHAINRFLGQRQGHSKRLFTKEEVVSVRKRPANYVQDDGKEVHYYDGLAVIILPQTGEVVTLITTKRVSTRWKIKL